MARKAGREHEFESYFSAIYLERWPALRAALLLDNPKTVLNNPFGHGLSDYSLDRASVFPVRFLDLQEDQIMADFCASPGGKSLASVFGLRGRAHWFCNDLSASRMSRLKSVFHDSLPPEILANRVHFSVSDASRWGLKRQEHFDRVLVDAPCSGERHLLHSTSELKRWSLKGAKRLVIRQHALLCSALDCTKPGGRVVYSTCSINPLENDGVIQRLNRNREGKFRVLAAEGVELGEATEHGRILLPDRDQCGPIYFSILLKV